MQFGKASANVVDVGDGQAAAQEEDRTLEESLARDVARTACIVSSADLCLAIHAARGGGCDRQGPGKS